MKKLFFALFLLISITAKSQELNCNVAINYAQIQGTNTQVFESLKTSILEFMNNRKWTALQYNLSERINCSFSIVVKEYNDNGQFKCELTVQSSRPVFNTSYQTTIYNYKDPDFGFTYLEFDPLELRDNQVDNNLTAVLAYYAYTVIGWDLDSQALKGGTDILRLAENIVNQSQTSNSSGWKAFENNRNRHALINDYLDETMLPYREAMYQYHLKGIDEMAQNADRGRAAITSSLELIKKAKENRPMSILPMLFTDIKRDELINVYSKGTVKEREQVYEIVMYINASQKNTWDKIKQLK